MGSYVKKMSLIVRSVKKELYTMEERRRGDVSDRHATDFSDKRGSAGIWPLKEKTKVGW